MKQFAVLQLSGCAGCEVSLLNAEAWLDEYRLTYTPPVVSAYKVPEVDLLLVGGGVRTDEDLHDLSRADQRAQEVVRRWLRENASGPGVTMHRPATSPPSLTTVPPTMATSSA